MSLGGGKNDKSSICILDYYTAPHKLFIKEVHEKIFTHNEESADDQIVEYLNRKDSNLKFIAFDVPITLPQCFVHACKGVHQCGASSTKWHWRIYKKLKEKNKNHKLFNPYVERCVDLFIAHQLEEKFPFPCALGANAAPLTARAHHLRSRFWKELDEKLIEVYPRLSFWRMGLKLKLPKSNLRFYKHAVRGHVSREQFLSELIKQNIIFIYEQDAQKILDRPSSFDAFLTALTAYLKFKGCTEKPPKGFPTQEGWVEYPDKDFDW